MPAAMTRRMTRAFDEDAHANQPRILFVGLAQSSHTHAWIDLLADSALNVRLFAIPGGVPPSDWLTKTYLYADQVQADSDTRRHWYSGLRGRTRRYYHKAARRARRAVPDAQTWLADVV